MQLRNSKTSKMLTGLTGVAMALSLSLGAAVAPASAATADELQAQIASLLSTIQSLQSQLNTVKGGSTTSTVASFARDLQVGSKGDDVKALQVLLNKSADTVVASTGAGSAGNETTTFGPATKAAVKKFQTKNGITPVSGFVGPKTRAVLNSMGGTVTTTTGGTTTTTTPMGSGLTVTAGTQPAMGLLPPSAARVPFTRVNLTASADGDVVVNGITVERTGAAQDSVFAGIVLIDENGQQIGVSKTLNSNHQVTVGEPFTVKAGTTKMVTIAGNGASAATMANLAGQVASLTVVGVNTSATVNGSLPITGTSQVVNATLSVGSVTMNVSTFDPNTSSTKEIGTTGFKFAGVRVTAGSAEKLRLYSVRWNQSGSASSNDLANVKVNVDGTDYPTTVSSDGKYYTALFGSGIVIDKGFSKDIYISGDVVGSGAAGRTVKFDIYKTTDLYLSGETYGYGVSPAAGSATASNSTSEFTASTPWFDGSLTTISAGSATSIGKATSVAAGNVAVNVPNQILGGFETDFKGEPISVQSMNFSIATTSTGGGLITNVSIFDENGSVVAGPVDASNAGVLAFTDTVTFPVGKKVYTIKGKLPSTFTNNGTIVLSTTPSSWTNVQGQTTGNSISLSGMGAFNMNTMTVKAAALAIAVSPTPAAQTVVSGGQARLFANIQLDASQSGEDVRFSSIPLKYTFTGTPNYLSTCQLFDGSTLLNGGSNTVSPASTVVTGSDVTFTFDQSLTVPKNTVKTLALKCNVSSSATTSSSYQWGIQASPSIAVSGITSSNDVTETVTASTGQAMTIGAGAVTVTTSPTSPSYSVVAAGTTGNVLGVYQFRATNEAHNLTKIGLTLTNTASSSNADLNSVTLWDGATQIGSATFSGNSAVVTLTSALNIPKDTNKNITIKGDLVAQDSSSASTPGHLVAIDVDVSGSNTQATGVDSGATHDVTGSTAVAGVRIFRSFPIFTYSTTQMAGSGAGLEVLSLNVAANASGEVQLYKLTFAIATSTATFTSPTFVGPNGAVNTTAITLTDTTLTVLFDNASNTADRVIGAGSSKTYSLRGTLTKTGNSGANGSVAVGLKADTAYPLLQNITGNFFMSSTTNSSITSANIIWSPSSTTTVTTAANDWTNGYGLGGCFTASGLGQNCISRTTGN